LYFPFIGGCWRLASFKRRARAAWFCDILGPDVQNITELTSVTDRHGNEKTRPTNGNA